MAVRAIDQGPPAGAVRSVSGPPRWVEPYVGLPYRERGHDQRGVHCWGLVWLVYKECLGVELHRDDTVTSAQLRKFSALLSRGASSTPWAAVVDRKDYDVMLLSSLITEENRVCRLPAHVGVVAGDHLLHVERGTNAVCVLLSHPSIKSRVLGCYRYLYD